MHATTKEVPRERFERDEHALLLPLPARPYHSPVLPLAPRPRPRAEAPGKLVAMRQVVEVERRPLSVYAAIAGGTP